MRIRLIFPSLVSNSGIMMKIPLKSIETNIKIREALVRRLHGREEDLFLDWLDRERERLSE